MKLAIIWTSFMGVFGIIAIIGNVVVICAIRHSRRLRTASNVFTCILCVVDICCVVVHCLKYAFISFTPNLTHSTCALLTALATIGCGTNLSMIYVVGIDKLVAIYRPFRYRTWMFARRAVNIGVIAVIVMIVIQVIAIAFYIDWGITGPCVATKIVTHKLTVGLSVFTFLVTVQLVCMYYALFKKALQHKKDGGDSTIGIRRNERSKMTSVLELKAVKTCCIVLGTFLSLWIPRLVLFNLIAFSKDAEYWVKIGALGSMFPILNSAVDPVIYAVMRKDVRDGVFRLFRTHREEKLVISRTVLEKFDPPSSSS